ncbi:hypothetical protein GALMADRAFT_148961 [Galerina marginata CBS 339.88]|uniref:Uncharacterized protein n=1 Tax=Galerina marginata (strain CBS 339.88) TaxID=685588 RepID=A0A067SBJ5_GALM3|nr:hypothetical protein GALMADRAFT_148961 [Galerina marginata CBS 339.88]
MMRRAAGSSRLGKAEVPANFAPAAVVHQPRPSLTNAGSSSPPRTRVPAATLVCCVTAPKLPNPPPPPILDCP